jgi:hypothetical protein
MELTPELVGATETRQSGIIGEQVDLNLIHTGDVRPSQVLYELTSHLVLNQWRDPGEDPKLHLFGQLKRIARQWLDECLVCKGGTYPAQLKYKMLADMACNRITAGITQAFLGERPIKALLDAYNPAGSTTHVRFTTSKTDRWETDSERCHINWVILDSDWEAEFCRVAEGHPRVRAYVKNHNLGLEVPYRFGSEMRKYRPDFIVLVDDGHGLDDLLHLIVEIKGYRREDAKEKKSTMDTYWVPGVNHLKAHGRWDFAEFTDVYQIAGDFKAKVNSEFNWMIDMAVRPTGAVHAQTSQTAVLAAEEILKHFGTDAKWLRLNQAIWHAIDSSSDQSLHLSDIDRVAKSSSTTGDDALALIGLLSRPAAELLRIELRSDRGDHAMLQPSAAISKLADWWKRKTLTEQQWREWAAGIIVRWLPIPQSR